MRIQRAHLVLIFAAVLALLVMSAPAAPREALAHNTVLILFNKDSSTLTQIAIERALRATLKSGSAVPVEVYSEYVGNPRAGQNYEKEFVALLTQKYEGNTFDLIICVGQFPLTTILRNRQGLFPDVPIVSVAIDRRAVADLYPAPGMTGVWGEIGFKANLDLALALHPGTKRVVVAHGVSETDIDWANKAKNDFAEYGSRVEFDELSGLTVPEMRDALANLPLNTIVFFISSIRDHAGDSYESPDYLGQVTPATTAPIYGTTDGQLGHGIVGGSLLSFDALGTEGAKVGLRVLAGERPDTIAPHLVPSVPMFDARQLERWGVTRRSLPAGSIVEFQEPTAWEEYKWPATALLGAITIETLLIGWLVLMRRRQHQAKAERLLLSSRLEEIVSNVPGIVWETRTDPETNKRKTTFISDYVEKMLGYSADEWLAQRPGFGGEIMPAEDLERAVLESERVMETGEEGLSEFRWVTKDGRVRWIENYLSPIFNGNRDVVGLRGVALDVTNRKLAEEKAHQAEEKDRAILAAIPDLMFLQSPDGVYLDYHATDVNGLLVPPEDFIGKRMGDIFPPDLSEQFAKCFSRAEEGGKPQILDYSLGINGTERWYEARMVRTGNKILSVVREITDRKHAEQERLELSGRLIRAQEDERSRIARELHDGVRQNLALISLELSMMGGHLSADELYTAIRQVSSRVAGVSGELRRISRELHPARLEQLGLVEAIREFCREIEVGNGMSLQFEENGVPKILNDNIALGLYRIAQESIQNAVAHSGAAHIRVGLEASDNDLRLEIADDGRGFDTKARPIKGSLGLVSMRERVRLLSGTMTLESGPEVGTRVVATVPM